MPRSKRQQKQKAAAARIARWQRLLARQDSRCGICGDRFSNGLKGLTLDHVVPTSKGGVNGGNKVVAHFECNNRKGDRMPTGCEIIWLMVANAYPKGGLPPKPGMLLSRRVKAS